MRQGRSKRRDAVTIVLVVVGFSIASAAFGASKLQNNSGGTWAHAFLVSVPVVLAMATPVGIIMVVSLRDRGDRMPPELWSDRAPHPSPDTQTYTVGRGYRIGMVAFFACMAIAAPFFVVGAVTAGPGATIFVGCWVVIMVFVFRSWRRSSPLRLTLSAEELTVSTPDGSETHVPLSVVSEVRWPFWGGYVRIVYAGGTIDVPKQMKHLDGLVIELRRRNPAIGFDGSWPPANVR